MAARCHQGNALNAVQSIPTLSMSSPTHPASTGLRAALVAIGRDGRIVETRNPPSLNALRSFLMQMTIGGEWRDDAVTVRRAIGMASPDPRKTTNSTSLTSWM